MDVKSLYSSEEIREKIRELFSIEHSKRRRVACVAYIGEDCLDYIQYAKGVEIYCWPQVGSTNPIGLNRLITSGANVFFVDNLHAKIYWTEGVGVLVTSANLSKNALAGERLHEFGVYFDDSKQVDIDRLLRHYAFRQAKEEEILRLKRESDLKEDDTNKKKSKSSELVLFEEWCKAAIRMPWKFCWTDDEEYKLLPSSKRFVESNYTNVKIRNWSHARIGEYKKGDWLLQFSTKTGKIYSWMFINEIIPKNKNEELQNIYPLMAVQLGNHSPHVPFHIDKSFRKIFKKTLFQYGIQKIYDLKNSKVPKVFLSLLEKEISSSR